VILSLRGTVTHTQRRCRCGCPTVLSWRTRWTCYCRNPVRCRKSFRYGFFLLPFGPYDLPPIQASFLCRSLNMLGPLLRSTTISKVAVPRILGQFWTTERLSGVIRFVLDFKPFARRLTLLHTVRDQRSYTSMELRTWSQLYYVQLVSPSN